MGRVDLEASRRGQDRPALTLTAAIALAPALALAALSVYWMFGALRGDGLWPPDQVTLAEAIGTRNSAEAARLIGLGHDPNTRERVRAGILAGHDVRVTPLEAAVWVRDSGLVKLLLQYGAIADRDEVRVLRCLEEAVGGRDAHEVLVRLSPDPWPSCADIPLPQ